MTTFSRRRFAVIASTILMSLAAPAAPALASVHHHHPVKHHTAKVTTHHHHATKHASKKAKKVTKAATKVTGAKKSSSPRTTVAAATDATPTLASRLASVKVAKTINYYPSTAAWSKMWTAFDPTTVDADLAKAQALGANNVRAIIFPGTFGYPTPKPAYMAELNTFVTLAASHGMTVKFTLFDWWEGYRDTEGSGQWAANILKPYKDDKRVIAVEVKNEFDATDTAGLTWAKKIVPSIRTAAPTMPLTFSVDGTAGATGMAKIKAAMTGSPLDYYDFHFYGNSERALANIRRAQAAVAPTPIVIGEVGLNTLQNTEGEQAAFLARVFEAAKVAGVGSVAPWTLNDFTANAIPDSDVADLAAQYNYGLYRTDGTAKPAAAVVKAEWTGTALPSNLMDLSFENSPGQGPWSSYLPELGVPTRTKAVAHTGTWSISFSNTVKNDAAGMPSYRVAPITPVQAGQKWTGSVYARGNAATGTTQMALSWFDINDKWLGGTNSASLPAGTTGWTKLSVAGTAPAGAASMQVHLKSGDNTGTVWFDDVTLASS